MGCKEKSTDETNNIFSKIKPTMQAVNAYANALKEMHNTMCAGVSGICSEMRSKKGSHFFKSYLIETKTNFIQNNREDARFFDDSGELDNLLAGYDVNQFQQKGGNMGYETVGKWIDGRLELDIDKMSWYSHGSRNSKDNELQLPTSSCRTICPKGYGFVSTGTVKCCSGFCKPCKDYEYVDTRFFCKDCVHFLENNKSKWYIPSEDRRSCVEPKMDDLLPVSIFLSASGTLLTLICIITFIKYRNTPVIRHSCKEHCLISLFGILFLFLLSPAFELPRTRETCILFRFIMPLGSSMMYSPLLVKINRMYRIFYLKLKEKDLMKLKKIALRQDYIDLKSQMAMIIGFVCMSIFIALALLISNVPDALPKYPNRVYPELLKMCSSSDTAMMISHIYNVLLILACTYYAVLTRKIPDNFRETRNIALAMSNTCVLWMAMTATYFVMVSLSIQISWRMFGIMVSVSTFPILLFVFCPKTYIVLFKPEKNTRKEVDINGLNSLYATSAGQSSGQETSMIMTSMISKDGQ